MWDERAGSEAPGFVSARLKRESRSALPRELSYRWKCGALESIGRSRCLCRRMSETPAIELQGERQLDDEKRPEVLVAEPGNQGIGKVEPPHCRMVHAATSRQDATH